MWLHWLWTNICPASVSQVFFVSKSIICKSQCSHMWLHWLLLGTCDYIDRNIYNAIYCAITFNLHDKLFHRFDSILVFNNVFFHSTFPYGRKNCTIREVPVARATKVFSSFSPNKCISNTWLQVKVKKKLTGLMAIEWGKPCYVKWKISSFCGLSGTTSYP